MEEVFNSFLKDKLYTANFSPKTVKSYREIYGRWKKYVGAEPTAQNIKDFVIKMRDAGLSVTTINISIRSFNSFLSWLHENGYTKEHLRLKQIRQEKQAKQGYSALEVKQLLDWKPKNRYEKRLYALIAALVDTGCRIDELLNLKPDHVDWENRLIAVVGKKKERIIPISDELRRLIWPFRELDFGHL